MPSLASNNSIRLYTIIVSIVCGKLTKFQPVIIFHASALAVRRALRDVHAALGDAQSEHSASARFAWQGSDTDTDWSHGQGLTTIF